MVWITRHEPKLIPEELVALDLVGARHRHAGEDHLVVADLAIARRARQGKRLSFAEGDNDFCIAVFVALYVPSTGLEPHDLSEIAAIGISMAVAK